MKPITKYLSTTSKWHGKDKLKDISITIDLNNLSSEYSEEDIIRSLTFWKDENISKVNQFHIELYTYDEYITLDVNINDYKGNGLSGEQYSFSFDIDSKELEMSSIKLKDEHWKKINSSKDPILESIKVLENYID